jgi:polysaccharide biosynthesis transport protein
MLDLGRVSTQSGSEAQSAATEGEPLDLARYWRVPLKRKWLVLAVAAAAAGSALFWALRQPRIYEASATLDIEPNAPNVLGGQVSEVMDLGAGVYWNNREYFETQYKILQSRETAQAVVERLKLDRDPRFFGSRAAPAKFNPRGVATTAEMLRGMLRVEPLKDTRLVRLFIQHTDPEMAQLLANTLARTYIDRNLDRVLASTAGALDWLTKQADTLRTRLSDSERDLYEFKKANNVLSVSLEDRQNLISNELQNFSDSLVKTRTSRIELEAQRRELMAAQESAKTGEPVWPRASSDDLLREAESRYAKLLVDRKGLETRYGPRHPRVQDLEAQLVQVRAAVREQVERLLRANEFEYQAIRRKEHELERALGDVQARGLDLNKLSIDYNRLLRERQQNEKLYDMVLSRTKETDLAQLLHFNNISILDEALRPEAPVSPRTRVIGFVALVVGLGLGIALSFLLEALDFTVRSHEDLEAELRVAVLGVLPAFAGGRRGSAQAGNGRRADSPGADGDLVVDAEPRSIVAECMRAVRTNLMFMTTERPLRRVLVTSPGPEEGKTFVATSLAVVMAQSGKRVLIVDTDLRRPRMHKVFSGVDNGSGLTVAIAGQVRLEDVVQQTRVGQVSVLPCGPVPPNPAELLHTKRFAELLDRLGASFDLIVLDSPPLGAVTDAAILSRLVDGTVLVARQGKTHKGSLRLASRQLQDLGSHVLGVILNDADFGRSSYYRYDYYRKYGYGPREDLAPV